MSEATQTNGPGRFLAYLELVRLPNLFTAMADVAMGFLVTRPMPWEPVDYALLPLLLVASCALYAGGVALNDVCDAELDAEERPERPLPSGRVSRPAAVRLAVGLLVAGVVLGGIAAALARDLRPAAVAAGLVGCIALYDAWLKHTPLGPLGMGACRALNVLLGMSAAVSYDLLPQRAAGPWGAPHAVIAGALGLYVVGVTWLARGESRRGGRLGLILASLVVIVGVAALALVPVPQIAPGFHGDPQNWRLFVLILAGWLGYRCLQAAADPEPERVQGVVAQLILSLVILDAAVSFLASGPLGAGAVAALLAPALVLQWWFDST